MSEPKHLIDRESSGELDDLRRRLDAGRRADDSRRVDEQLDGEELEDRVAAGMVKGFALIVNDDKLVKKFGRRLYEELVEHWSNGTSQWFGKRLFLLAVGMIVTWGMVVLIRNGSIK
jgi:hypothetical protein